MAIAATYKGTTVAVISDASGNVDLASPCPFPMVIQTIVWTPGTTGTATLAMDGYTAALVLPVAGTYEFPRGLMVNKSLNVALSAAGSAYLVLA